MKTSRQIMPTLFSYCIPYDDGAAPNPFWGRCTLAICKPAIRQAAEIGDWVVGTGSKHSPIGDIAGTVVYAMQVTQKMTMEKYDQFTRSELPNKIPHLQCADPRRWYGDSIYDFSTPIPSLRPSVHDEQAQYRDLRGQYVLLSDHFYYFGDQPVPLPPELRAIAQQQQGHRSWLNVPYVNAFVRWIESGEYSPVALRGDPQGWQNIRGTCTSCPPRRFHKPPDSCSNSSAKRRSAGHTGCQGRVASKQMKNG